MSRVQLLSEQYERMVNSDMIGILTFHMDGRVLEANDYVLRLVGYTRADLQEHRIQWDKMTPPEFWDRELAAHAELKLRGVCEPFQKEYIHRLGHRVPIWVGGAMVPGTKTGVCFVLDISLQKQMERDLQNRERDFRALTEHTTVGIARARDIRAIEYLNPTMRDWFGIPRDSALEKINFLDFCTPASAAKVQDEIKRRLKGESTVYEIEIVSQQKKHRHLIVSGVPLLGPSGEVESFVATFVDISEIRKSFSILKLIVESLPEGVLLVDSDEKILAYNQRFAEVWDFPIELLQETYQFNILENVRHKLVDPEDFFRKRSEVGALKNNDHFPHVLELKDGRYIELYRKILDLPTQSSMRVICARDVTNQKKIDQHLMHTDRMATVGALAAGMAHEINNPLTHLIGGLEQVQRLLATDAPLTPKESSILKDKVHLLLKSSLRISEIVKDLNLFSRNDHEDLEPVDVRHAIETIFPFVQIEIKNRARLITDFDEVPFCIANEGRLGQVFLNLIVNALQAMPAETADQNTLYLSIKSRDSKTVEIEVRDNGVGIAPENLKKIFQPFFTTKPIGTGTGLGLSICFNLIQKFKGEIQVHSQLNVGTSFKVLLPAALPSEARSHTSATPKRNLSRKVILIVDDEEEIRDLIASEFENEHEVLTAKNGFSALEILNSRASDVHLILCDLIMPGLSGTELFAKSVSTWPEISQKFLFLTGGAINPEAQTFIQQRPKQVLLKPFSLSQLRDVIAGRLANP